MEFEDALFKWTAAQSSVTQFIGAAPQQVRFYKGKAPQGVKGPFMIQQRNGRGEQPIYCGIDGAVALSWQIDVYSRDWPTMAAAALAFRRALRAENVNGTNGYPVWMGDGDSPAVAVKVKAAFLDNEFDGVDPDPGLFRRTQLWTFWIADT